MKKLLSLLSMLMITVMAFATDYKGQLNYTVTTRTNDLTGPSYANGTLKIEDYAGGKYTVTATGCDLSSLELGNWDEIICEGVEGKTDANGVTTIDVTPYAFRSSDNGQFKDAKLFVKFKGDKAYATFEGTYNPNFYTYNKLKYTFGVDEGFDGGGSTGGGETGGETKEKYTVNFDKTAKHSRNDRILSGFSLQQTGKDKQTENVFASKAAYEDHTSKVFTVEAGSELTASFNYSGQWMNGYVYIDRDNDGEFSYNKGQWNQAGTDLVAYSFYTTLDTPKTNDSYGYNSTGASVSGDARSNVNPPAFTAPTEPGTYRIRFKVDWNCIFPGGSNDILSDGGGVWDATLEVVAAAPTVDKEVPFTGVAFTVSNGMNGNADVTFKEMSDETVQMTFASSSYNISATNLTKDTDTKGRTTYTGTAANDAMSTVTYTVKAVVYTAEGGAQKLYMTLMAADGTTFTVGEDPDYVAPVTYKNTLYVVENAKLLLETPEAEVVLQDKGDNKYDVTLPAFTAGGMNVPSITFEATKADNKLTASSVSVPNVYNGEAAVVTMDGTIEADNKLFASLTVKCGESFDYEVGYGIKPFVATTQEYTAEWANVKVGDAEPVNFQNAKADYTEFAKGQYSLTFKDLTFGEKKIGDFTIKYVKKDADDNLSTTAAAGTWTRVEAGQDVASLGDEASISGFEGRLGGTGVLIVKFTMAVDGTTGNVAVDFGNKYEAPIEGTVVEQSKDFAANGSKFEWSNIAIDWNKQKLVAVIDLSSCKGTSENILSVGQNIGEWPIGGWHFYYTVASKKMKSDYLATGGAHPVSDPKTGVEPGTVRIELSKAEGCTIDGVSYNALYDSNVTGTWQSNTEDFWKLTSVNIGSKEGVNRSHAVIKYVTVVDLPVTVKETKEFTDAMSQVAGDASMEVGQAKVTIKEMTDETVSMTLAIVDQENAEYTASGFVKAVDAEKNRTTYTGTLEIEGDDYAVTALVYTEGTVEKLYMVAKGTECNYVIGTDPDAPKVVSDKTYRSNLKLTDAESEEDVVDMSEADVNIIKYSDESYKVTLKKVALRADENDLVFVGKALEETTTAEAADLYISAKPNTATKGILGDVTATFAISEVSEDEIKMGIAIEGEGILYEGEFNYDDDVETPVTYTSNLHIYDTAAPETDLFQTDNATVELLYKADGTYTLAIKNVTLNEKTQDLVFTGTSAKTDITGTADEATATFLGVASATIKYNVSFDKNDNLVMTFTITAGEKTLGGEFNYEKKDPDTPVEPTIPMENYQADGKGFVVSTDIDWSKQKFQAIIDATKCSAANTEEIFGFGEEATAWFKNIHVYADKGSYKAYFQYDAEAGNNNTTLTIADQSNITIEVSKAEGLTVDGVVVIAAEKLTGIFDLTTVKFGSGENSQYSNALYKSVKLVDLPKDPETGINAINAEVANGEAQLFTVNGVKLNKLQKGLNIVRTADGKVKKVLVK